MFLRGQPAPSLLYKFNFNISASRQNIKNLIGNFGAIYVGMMQAKFQVSSFPGVGGE